MQGGPLSPVAQNQLVYALNKIISTSPKRTFKYPSFPGQTEKPACSATAMMTCQTPLAVLRDEVLADGLGHVAEAEVLAEHFQGGLDGTALLRLRQSRLSHDRLLRLRPLDDLCLGDVPRSPEDDHVQIPVLDVQPSLRRHGDPTTVVHAQPREALPPAAVHLVEVLVHGASERCEVGVASQLRLRLLEVRAYSWTSSFTVVLMMSGSMPAAMEMMSAASTCFAWKT
eukprot:CAMPEP_0176280386 /NCGR_PEP_ID=MMETSP0121_2-20121125/49762_1 /TAXON_ID=160619 /ORGANISM="Kryptoperidinium foliaceum, Strain CCMP 1326" /LENGTH=226 /DNA_ID=CAMNT_0017620707 /DNA_START=115 /DNA_END=791 /DNA_ORIENTATION=-